MKKNVAVQLDSTWWSKNKAKTLSYKGFGNALKAYEIKRELLNYPEMHKALKTLEKERVACIAACSAKAHAETIAGLERYKPVIQAEVTKIKKDAVAWAKNAAAAEVPKQKLGKSVVIWERDIAKDVVKASPVDVVNWTCKLTLKLDASVLDALEAEEDYVTPAFMVEDAQAVGDTVVKVATNLLKNYAKNADGKSEAEQIKLQKVVVKDILSAVDAGRAKLTKIPAARFKKFVARKKQYKDYQIKCAAEAAVSTVTILTTVSGIVLTGGVGGIVGVIGMVRNSAAIANQVHSAWMSAETVGNGVEKDIKTLQKRYLDDLGEAKKAKQNAAEVGATTMKMILGTDVPFLATLPKCQTRLELWDNKVAGVAVRLPKLSKSLMQAISAADKFEKDLKQGNDPKKIKKAHDKLLSARKLLTKALDLCSAQAGQVAKFEKEHGKLEANLKKLADANSWGTDKFEKYGPTVVNLLIAGLGQAGIGTGPSSGNTGTKALLETINTIEATIGTVEGEVIAHMD